MSTEKLVILEIPYNPPPDRSYPPRFLTTIYGRETIWLPDQQLVWLIPNELAARRDQAVYSLIPNLPRKSSLSKAPITPQFRVNGEPLVYNHVLQDGDFIYKDDQHRLIFQVDPVRDRKFRMVEKPGTSITLAIPTRLYEKVLITPEGVSFAGENQLARWPEIVSLHIEGSRLDLRVRKKGRTQPLKTRLQHLSKEEIQALADWLRLMQPFDLSVTTSRWYYAPAHAEMKTLFEDAYTLAAQTKIIAPAQVGERPFPVVEQVLPTAGEASAGMVYFPVLMALFLFLTSAIPLFMLFTVVITLDLWIVLLYLFFIGAILFPLGQIVYREIKLLWEG